RGWRVPPPALARRARPARGGAAALLRGHHPGPPAPLPEPRLEPHALRRHSVQPAEPLPGGDPRGPGQRGRGQPAGGPPPPGVDVRGGGSTVALGRRLVLVAHAGIVDRPAP